MKSFFFFLKYGLLRPKQFMNNKKIFDLTISRSVPILKSTVNN